MKASGGPIRAPRNMRSDLEINTMKDLSDEWGVTGIFDRELMGQEQIKDEATKKMYQNERNEPLP